MRTRQLLTISIPPAFLKDLERVAKKEGRTKSELAREALRRYIAEQQEWESLFLYGQQQARKLGIRSEAQINRVVKEYRKEQMKKAKSA